MSRLAKGELLYGDLMPVDELLARVDAVTLDEVNTLAADLLARPMSLAVVGPFGDPTSPPDRLAPAARSGRRVYHRSIGGPWSAAAGWDRLWPRD